MKKMMIILTLLGYLISATAQKPKTIPVIDINKALADKKPMKLSEIVTNIEYLKLQSPVNHTKKLGLESVIVGNKVIVLKSSYYQKLFVFDREGNFIRYFGEIGNNPGDFFRIGGRGTPSSWDLSADEKKIIVQDQSCIKMFSINGKFLGSCPLPTKDSKFFFLDNDHIIVCKSIRHMKTDGNQLFVYNSKLELTDSLFWVKSADLRPDQNENRVFLPGVDFYKLRSKIYFRSASQDTLFEILPELKVKPMLVFDFGELKPPLKWQTRDEIFDQYMEIDYLVETPAYFIAELTGPLRKDSVDYINETLFYEKETGKYFTTKRLSSNPDSVGYYEGIIDDIDRFGFSGYTYSGEDFVNIIQPEYLIKTIESNSSGLIGSAGQPQIDKLKTVLGNVENESLALRIVSFDKPELQRKRMFHKPAIPIQEVNLTFKPVRTSHEWAKADWLSDITYDPSDDSFWMAKMPKVDTIEHRNRMGEKLPGCFTINEPTNIEGITVSTADHTLWLVDNFGKKVIHYDRQGKKLGDGFLLDFDKQSGRIFGIAFDQSDSTLWMIETEQARIWHYSTTGQKLGNSIDILHSGCNNGRGLAYDPRDNSLWIVNASPNRIIHINKQGNLLPGSFYFDISLWLPDGVGLDSKNSEFWIGDWGTKQIYLKNKTE